MTARAIYKGRLRLNTLEVPVKLYSAVDDRSLHFRLLHAVDREPVVQELIDKTTEQPVAREEVRKAYPLGDHRLVRLQEEELQTLAPPDSREFTITRFVDPALIAPAFYDRPYYLGPDGDPVVYFALARALAERQREGIASWTMRNRVYLGALREHQGYLVLISLKHREEVLELGTFPRPKSKEITPQELQLAQQLVDALAGPFDPSAFHDDYRQRVLELVERKASGEVPSSRPKPRKAAPTPVLAEALKNSLKAVGTKKSA
jgi:DNA end-binding protein Ku